MDRQFVSTGPCAHQWGYMTATGGIACTKCREARLYTDPEAIKVRGQFMAAAVIEDEEKSEYAYGYATRLLASLVERLGKPPVAPQPDMIGVLTQIDNATTGFVPADAPPMLGEAEMLERARASAAKMFNKEGRLSEELLSGNLDELLWVQIPLDALRRIQAKGE